MKISGIMKSFGLAAVLAALPALTAEQPPPPRGKMAPGMRSGRHSVIWRCFSQLDDEGRKKMLELQRNAPEKFNAEMRRLADEYEKKENLRRQKLASLIEKYRGSTDKAERERLKAEVAQMEKTQFERRMAELSRIVSSTRRRLAMMEQELNKRREKADAIVKARVEALLSGELPVAPPRRRGGNHPFPPPKPAPEKK